MKKAKFLFVVLTLTACHAGAGQKSPDPVSINLPATFSPKADDFADEEDRGQFMGVNMLRGRPLKPRDGVHAIYVVKAPEAGALKGDPFQVGDLILGIDGNPFSADCLNTFKRSAGHLEDFKGQLRFERWRQGKLQMVSIPLGEKTPPDLTRGGVHDPDQEDWALGATGAQGWIWAIPHKSTEGSTQVYVTQIEPGSPADGVLKVGDVVTGAFGGSFTHDARIEFGHALSRAESDQGAGKLVLSVWNGGETREVTLQLKTMGTYRDTSPFACPKTQRIVDDACRYLIGHGVGDGIAGRVNALGLLATGRDDVMPLVREHVAKVAAEKPSDSSWDLGYSVLLMAEYHLATGDESVLPALRESMTRIARGQSTVGTWGHRMCFPYEFSDGTLYGIPPGYGALNQAGLICMVSLALAEPCGIENDDITLAIKRGSQFFRYYVDRGAIPYGDHAPNLSAHDDNGKVSVAAVLFDLLGDKEAATFFTRMSVASYNDRESGHTGNYFSFLWGPLGAARGGEEAASAFMKKLEWFFDLERRRQGNFEYQGKPGMPNRQNAEHQYKGWDCTGARLLAYCLPLRKLYITGRKRTTPDITGSELEATVAAGALSQLQYFDLPTGELLSRLSSWSPAERQRVAIALETRNDSVVDEMVAMLDSENRFARYGAVQGLRFAGRASEKAADTILEKLRTSKDDTFKFFAIHAFGSYNEKMGLAAFASKATPVLMKLAVSGHFDDPTGKLRHSLAYPLFYSSNGVPFRATSRNGEGLEQVDRKLLVETVRELLKSSNGVDRSMAAIVYQKLGEDERQLLWKDIHKATRELAPSGLMFASEVRLAGIELMAEHHVKECMTAAVSYLSNQKFHGNTNRAEKVLQILVDEYGAQAAAVIPDLEKSIAYFKEGPGVHPMGGGDFIADKIREAIKAIQAKPPEDWKLVSIADQLEGDDHPSNHHDQDNDH